MDRSLDDGESSERYLYFFRSDAQDRRSNDQRASASPRHLLGVEWGRAELDRHEGGASRGQAVEGGDRGRVIYALRTHLLLIGLRFWYP